MIITERYRHARKLHMNPECVSLNKTMPGLLRSVIKGQGVAEHETSQTLLQGMGGQLYPQ